MEGFSFSPNACWLLHKPTVAHIKVRHYCKMKLTGAAGWCRAAEDELCAVSDERDQLQPQLEELRWRNRQADKELAQLKEAAEAAQQACDTP